MSDQENIIKLPPPKQSPADFSFCALYSPDGTVTRWAIVAPTIEELREAWDRITLGDLDLDESKVQRVEIHKPGTAAFVNTFRI